MKHALRALVLLSLPAAAGLVQAARDDVVTTAVFTKKARDYHRPAAAGRPAPEYFRLMNGGRMRGTSGDRTTSAVTFDQLSRLVTDQLARQEYLPSPDPHAADLLIFVHWGVTVPFNETSQSVVRQNLMSRMNDLARQPGEVAAAAPVMAGDDGTPTNNSLLAPDLEKAERERLGDELSAAITEMGMFDRQRMDANAWNARLLGYIDEINRQNGPNRWAGGGSAYDDLIADIEEARYYVILTAYDVQQTNREGRPKLQWVARMSIRAQGNRFDDKVGAMLASASRHFGRDSGKLIRRFERTPRVEVGEATVVGIAADPAGVRVAEPAVVPAEGGKP